MGNSIGDFILENFNKLKRYLQYTFEELSEADAEDIIQATAVKLLGSSRNRVDYLSSYVYKSVANGAKDYFRKSNRVVLTDSFDDLGEIAETEEDILNNELGEQIKSALYKLDEKSRHVFIETELGGKSYEELSKETGEPIGTLLSRKNRAKRKLRTLLESYVKDGGIK